MSEHGRHRGDRATTASWTTVGGWLAVVCAGAVAGSAAAFVTAQPPAVADASASVEARSTSAAAVAPAGDRSTPRTPRPVSTGPSALGLATRPATAAAPARYRPLAALPADSGRGRRIVYDRSLMHVWVLNDRGHVIRDYRVTGRPDWPLPGTYHVFLKTPWTMTLDHTLAFRWFVGFAHGHTTNIGFHDIPVTTSGQPIQTVAQLGAPIGIGGCVRAAPQNARWLYHWVGIGDTVVVLT